MNDSATAPLRLLLVEDSIFDYEMTIAMVAHDELFARAPVLTERVEDEGGMTAALRREPVDAVITDHNLPRFDSFAALIGPRGEGIDVDEVIASRRLLRDLPAEAIDITLALYVGYFFSQCEQPVPPTSPHIRDHQRWQGEVCWQWLAERRGWA